MKKWLKILLIVAFILIGLLAGFLIYQYSSNGKTITYRNDLYSNDLVDSAKLDNEVKEYYSSLNNFNTSNITTIEIVNGSFLPEGETLKKVTLNKEEMYSIFNILENITFSSETCDGLADYFIKINTQEKENAYTYGLEMYNSGYHITTVINGKSNEAILSSTQRNEIDKIINKYF